MASKTKQTTKRTPYDAAAVSSANTALGNANTAAQGTIAQWSPALNSAIGHINDNIATPPGYLTDARSQLDKTINGDYVNSNPYTGGLTDLIAQKAQGDYNASFGASGRSHGGLAALLSGQGVGDALQQFYGNQYNTDRGMQQQAIMAAPGFHQDQQTTDMGALLSGVNGTAMMPLNAANAYGQGVTTVNSPYTTDTTTTKQGFGLGQALGLAGMIGGAALTGGGSLAAGGGGLAGLLGGGSMAAFNPVGAIPGMTGAINNFPRFLG